MSRSKKVYLCPVCYRRGEIHDITAAIRPKFKEKDNRAWVFGPNSTVVCDRTKVNDYYADHKKKDSIHFDSPNEYAFYLKHLHGKPGITDIKIHPVINFTPYLIVLGEYQSETTFQFPYKFTYETDFIFRAPQWFTNGFVTGLIRKFIVDVKGNAGKNGPYLGKPTDAATFKKNCRLVRLIFGQDVLVYSSGFFWKWNDKFTRLEVIE